MTGDDRQLGRLSQKGTIARFDAPCNAQSLEASMVDSEPSVQ